MACVKLKFKHYPDLEKTTLEFKDLQGCAETHTVLKSSVSLSEKRPVGRFWSTGHMFDPPAPHADTHPAPPGRHGDHRRPLVGSGVVAFGAAQLCGVVSASHGVDHVLVDGAAQVLPAGTHGRHRVPAVLLRVVALHCQTSTWVHLNRKRPIQMKLLTPRADTEWLLRIMELSESQPFVSVFFCFRHIIIHCDVISCCRLNFCPSTDSGRPWI